MLKINNKKRELLVKLAEKYAFKLLVLFGSQVTGQTHKESDFDIGYISARSLDLGEEGQLMSELLPIIEQRDERVINLVNIRKAKPLFLYAITNKAHILFEKEPAIFNNLRAYAFKLYVEARPLYQAKAAALGIGISPL